MARAGAAARWLALRLYPLALVLAVWQALAQSDLFSNPFVLPAPAKVLERARLGVADGTLTADVLATGRRVLLAFALAMLAGVVLGLLIGRVRWVRLALRPIVSFLFPIPKVAIYPAILLIVGLGSASKVAFGFAEGLFPILLATAAAASQVDQRLLWSARALGTSRAAVFSRVVLPAALPGILTGARIGLVGAIIGVYLGEMITSVDGLGHAMTVGFQTLRIPDGYVSILTVSILGLILDRAFLAARNHLLAWSPEGDDR